MLSNFAHLYLAVLVCLGFSTLGHSQELTELNPSNGLQAGAAVVDVTPERLPIRLAGMFLERYAAKIHSPLKVRAIALRSADVRLVMAIVDSVGVPRDLLDRAKKQASEATGIAVERMLVAATHTHTAPPVKMSHGTDPELRYAERLRAGIAKAIQQAVSNLEPAQVGVAVVNAEQFAGVRRWILRPDRIREDPFGNPTVRASMHTARNHDDVTGPSGPLDPDLSVISFQSRKGRPIAVLANFANHYAGAPRVDGELAVSADYFGLFAERVETSLGATPAADAPAFVAIMSQGTSGDIATRDYWHPGEARASFEEYTDGIVDLATQAYRQIRHRSDVTLAMAQSELRLPYKLPDQQRLEWARRVYGEVGSGRVPQNQEEVYARHALMLNQLRETRLLVQAIRIGEFGITAIPNEVYSLTGLHLKARSPFATTVNIELANGSEGYLVPREQQALGGYNTWPALSACLVEEAEPRIVQAVLQLLERVAERPRRLPEGLPQELAAVRNARPRSYFRMDELHGPRAVDLVGGRDGQYETGVVFFLDGPTAGSLTDQIFGNRAAHFAGGRLRLAIPDLSQNYSVSLWCWNGLLTNVRPVTGYLVSRERAWGLGPDGDHLAIGGTQGNAGRLIFHCGPGDPIAAGRTPLQRWHWHHLCLVRSGRRVRVFLDGNVDPEIDVETAEQRTPPIEQLFIGGRSDNEANFEGRIDEVVLFDRSLAAEEVLQLSRTFGSTD